jgi:cobalamin synthase
LAQLTRLRTLSLLWDERVGNFGVAALSACVALTSLELGRCRRVSDSGLAALGGLGLRRLNINRCEALTERVGLGFRVRV